MAGVVQRSLKTACRDGAWTMGAALALLTALASPTMAKGLKVSQTARVFKGGQGSSIAITKLLPLESKQALIRIKGTESEADDLVFLAQGDDTRAEENYAIQWHGRKWYVFFGETSRWSNQVDYILNPPELGKMLSVTYDEKTSSKITPSQMQKQWDKDQKKVSTLAAFQLEDEKGSQMKLIAGEAESAACRCGKKIDAKVAWSSVDEEFMKTYSVSSFCAYPLQALSRLCETDNGKYKTKIQQKVESMECTFADDGPALRLEKGIIRWQVSTEAPNLDAFAFEVLRNEVR